MTRASFPFALLLAVLILAGCGGSPRAQSQLVQGRGFSFNAPAGWKVTVKGTTAAASHGSELLQVTAFPLVRSYDDTLFDKVKRELDARMKTVAEQAKGTITGSRTVTAGGGRAHSYRLTAGDDMLEYTFVLRGKREFELLCRRPSDADDAACKELLASFRPT
jgi:hypothetical protein